MFALRFRPSGGYAVAADESSDVDGHAEAFDAVGRDKDRRVGVLDGENALPHGELWWLCVRLHEEHRSRNVAVHGGILQVFGFVWRRGGHRRNDVGVDGRGDEMIAVVAAEDALAEV